MANVKITDLPAAGPITGAESVPIVQNGLTVRTTTSAISAAPSQTQTFITVNQEPTLPNSRALSGSNGIGITDGGAQSVLNLALNGAAGSLEAAGNGFAVKTGGTTVTARTLQTNGAGLTVANGNGQAGDPTFQLTGLALSIANLSGAGLVASTGSGSLTPRSIAGVANQITVTNADGAAGNPTVGIANNPILPGTGAVTIPFGSTADRPAGVDGEIRFNTDSGTYEAYSSGAWRDFSLAGGVTSFNAGTTGFTPVGATSGAITLGGTLNAANGGTGANTLTGYVKGNGTSPMTASTTVPTTDLSGTITSAQIVDTLTGKTLVSPEILNTLKFTGSGAAAYTPFAQTFASYVTDFNGYQLNYIQNNNNGSDASVDYVAYNDSSDVNSYFIDMGISSSNYTNPIYEIFPPNGAYVYTGGGTSGQASNLLLGTSNAASDITFFTGGTLLADTRATIKGNTGNVLVNTTTDTGEKFQVNGSTKFSGAAEFGGTVTLSADPTLALQATTKQYVDAATSSGFTVHEQVRLATVAALPANTYANGASGVGATLTANANGALSIDGTLTVVGNRVLIKDEVAAANNGAYTVTDVGSAGTPYVLTRATDFDQPGSGEITNNAYFYVSAGATNINRSYILSLVGIAVVGTTALNFSLFSAPAVYTGGANIDVTGQVISLTGTVPATNGGTGTSTVATGDLLYGSATDTWSKLPLSVAYKSLIINAAGTQVEWNAIPLNQTTAVSGQLGVSNGGTGLSAYTTGDIIYASAGTTLDKLSDIAVGNALITGGVGVAPSYGKIGLTTHVSGTLPVANGGTGAVTLTGYVQGTGTSALTASSTIPSTDITGLGTMAAQNASAVAITGGTIDGTTIGATTATTGKFTTVTATSGISGGTF